MTITGILVIYVIVWWTLFLLLLPFKVKGVWEEKGKHIKGVEQGAPVNPFLKAKAIRATWVGAIITAVICGVIVSGIISYE